MSVVTRSQKFHIRESYSGAGYFVAYSSLVYL